jgi:hypothetical protein
MAPDRFRMFLKAHMRDISVIHYLGVKPWMCTSARCFIVAKHSLTPAVLTCFQGRMTACHISSIIKVMSCTICGGSNSVICAVRAKSHVMIRGIDSKNHVSIMQTKAPPLSLADIASNAISTFC